MDSARVEVVKQGFAALANANHDTIATLLADDFEATTPPGLAAEPQTYRGKAAMRDWFDGWGGAMEQITFTADEFREVGDVVVVPFTLSARGTASGIEVDQHAVMAWTVRDGLATHLDLYMDLESALAAQDQA